MIVGPISVSEVPIFPPCIICRGGAFTALRPRQQFDFVRLADTSDEVIVTYEMSRRGGGRGRNAEILTFDGDRITGAEVYFGWNL
ncbi:MAG TPA: hypothetical protein VKT31_12705 [Solirubrobacteraceae bacterium]|nr:hypothetical protein [Solirubrobacteraceae bacterium]